ncbi:hypothetical protein CHS0354_023484 [Potamilus streckersoni]|uniref:DIS3-like exonuclease 2 n=1 Tax=Potamilus streckersoni TaxID=2493646 RepID=A0AAE0S7L5_9BIVA|nr:hypothetical protein CHS0354_023484 [Potamilus streckersoni]
MASIGKDDSDHMDESTENSLTLPNDRNVEKMVYDVNISQMGIDLENTVTKANTGENARTKKCKKRRRRRKNKATTEACNDEIDSGSTDMRQHSEFSDVDISNKNYVLQEQDIKELAPSGKSKFETARPKSCHVSQTHIDESAELIDAVNGQRQKKMKKKNQHSMKGGTSSEEVHTNDLTCSLLDSVSIAQMIIANETQNAEIVDRATKVMKETNIYSGKKGNDLTVKSQITNTYPENELQLHNSAACLGGNSVELLDSSMDYGEKKQRGHKPKGQLNKDISHIEQIVRDIKQFHLQPEERQLGEIGSEEVAVRDSYRSGSYTKLLQKLRRSGGRELESPMSGQGSDQKGHVQRGQGQSSLGGMGQVDLEKKDQRGQCRQKKGSVDKPHGPKQDKRQRKISYEPYISENELMNGLKRGLLIQGPLRINPRNYEESYIPHLDGKSDILIIGMKDRNRALNGDIVAVLLYDRDEWKIDNKELKYLEESSTPIKSGHDSDTDVVIESESIDLTVIESENPFPNCDNRVLNNRGDEGDSETEGSYLDLEKGLNRTENEDKGKSNNREEKKDDEGKKINDTKMTQDKQNSKQTPQKQRYTSLKDAMEISSPVVKDLFQAKEQSLSTQKAEKLLMRTGKVVAIIEKKHTRACTGHIRPLADKNPNRVLFSPIDHRLPRILLPMSDCPPDFKERPNDHANTLYIARITDWPENSLMALGRLARSLGEAGEIEPETEGILIENGVDYSEFPEEALESLPIGSPWSIPTDEMSGRRDFRQQCVFTIDPSTARDLDDAVSVEQLDDDLFEVGVHIADVSYFVKEDTELDKIAASRSTSVYLVQKVIPMLPRLLCEQLCSLNPDEDRLTFSVVWKMTGDGEIEEEWFGRSVIRSCVKLSYDHAQGFIEEPERNWTREELPPIMEGFSVQDIKDKVLILEKIAKKLRKKRFDSGALRLDQVKLQYSLDSQTGLPNGYWVYQQKDSNRLIEEFMLLANMAVAHKINSAYPEKAILRRHPPPQSKMADDLRELCENLGVSINIGSAGDLQKSLWSYSDPDDEYSVARMQVLVSLCARPMQNAKYFCAGCLDDENLYRHYALNVPLYTHFTSPIRRYPDILVHRLLAAALDYCHEPDKTPEFIQKQADHCNDRKLASKRVQDLSSELYFAVFVKMTGPLEEKGMVMGVLDKAFDVFILKLGVSKRVYLDKLPLKHSLYTYEKKVPKLTLTWKAEANGIELVQDIKIFSHVDCVLQSGEVPLQWMAVIKRPQNSNS